MTRFHATDIDSLFIVKKLNDPHHPRIVQFVETLSELSIQRQLKLIDDFTQITSHTLILSVGGDGTMLEAMRISAFTGAMCAGFHIGNIGFLNSYAWDDEDHTRPVRELLDSIADGTASVETRSTLSISTVNEKTAHKKRGILHTQVACNDVVVSRVFSHHMVRYEVLVDGVSAGTHRANALVVATPTGSTAYSLSAGGSLVLPTSDVIQIVPVAPNTLTSRPIIVPGSSVITVRVFDGTDAQICSDGNVLGIPERAFESLEIVPFRPATLVHPKGWNFFDTLSTKLGWMKDGR